MIILKKNILFLVLDSFPAEKCYGKNKTSITPNIDSMINKGVNFTQTITCSDGTELGWASIFTALYPFKTGLNNIELSKLSPDVTSYIKILKDNGYHPYAIMPKVSSLFGVTKDFENEDLNYESDERIYNGLGQKILNKIQLKELKEPWIYFIHLLDLHVPLSLPKKFNDHKFGNNQYERMVSAIDDWIGKILNEIKLENTIVVLTSDHGEYIHETDLINSDFSRNSLSKIVWKIDSITPSFLGSVKNQSYDGIRKISRKIKSRKIQNLSPYQKRSLLNSRSDPEGYLYDEIVHVPLIMIGGELKPKIISQQVRHVDIFPTLTDLVECTIDNDVIHGESLLPLLNDSKLDEKPAYIEGTIRMKKTAEAVVGIRTPKFKYFRSRDNNIRKRHLYNLENDPLEEHNIINNNPDIVKEMEQILISIQRDDKITKNQVMDDEESKQVEEELSKLGYI